MSSRFRSKLRREIKANPKKAAILALLLVVAIWFWVPIMAKWFSNPDSDMTAPANARAAAGKVATPSATANAAGNPTNTAATIAPTQTAAPSSKRKLPLRPWKQLAAWIEHDPRMTPATELAGGRDPFATRPATTAQAKPTETAPEPPDVSPTAAGLVLTSTIVGGGHKLALISNEVYREGATVSGAQDEREFRIVEIRPREVVLSRKGKLYILGLPTAEWVTKR
jgi:hypothetical protein